ncbi:hypothetical protein EVJ27_07530 [Exiguobacterium sp. SH3S2]|uniref:hypothetical protein n=1 Tax=unclassified Exiguobacterium TaxID=2644629 RepID=UPI001038CB93|nr:MULTISPECIES: hypothetical protein [unclassified Exiguobacterium]TCI45712.1 hypothetical protein EVJ28_07530 [Exiguobacterium sp. SH3S3]TCI60132.1 hypothetical protein EVJ26_11720 [Exiguobacterium sp. SH3S1]TCI60921.1 hypothetical protein EVJ27_07530 [Exiguobacterium sp. SH3S2]
MTHFLKLQVISTLSALTLLLNIQLLANSGRLYLLIGDAYVPVVAVIGLALLVSFARVLIRRLLLLPISRWNLFFYVLWLPYLALFTYGWTRIIPPPSEAAWPTPVVGLLIIALTLTFPLYIFIVHMWARSKQPTT